MARKTQDKVYDFNTALVVADSFRTLSDAFIHRIGDDLNEAPQRVSSDIGGLVASATTLALALELYLKALSILANLRVPETHHLWTLYKRLPNDLMQSVEAQYNHINSSFRPEKVVEHILRLGVSTKPDEIPDDNDDTGWPNTSNVDLKSVLVRSSDAFVTWRYLHESGRKGKMIYHPYEFRRLGLICDVVRRHVVDSTYRIHKQS